MEYFPYEINKKIFEYLTIKNIIKLCLLNKEIKKFINDTIWDHDILNIVILF
jgi:F-box associated protein